MIQVRTNYGKSLFWIVEDSIHDNGNKARGWVIDFFVSDDGASFRVLFSASVFYKDSKQWSEAGWDRSASANIMGPEDTDFSLVNMMTRDATGPSLGDVIVYQNMWPEFLLCLHDYLNRPKAPPYSQRKVTP